MQSVRQMDENNRRTSYAVHNVVVGVDIDRAVASVKEAGGTSLPRGGPCAEGAEEVGCGGEAPVPHNECWGMPIPRKLIDFDLEMAYFDHRRRVVSAIGG